MTDIRYVDAVIVNPEQEKLLKKVKLLAELLDNKFVIPGFNIRFGLDSIIGLVPGIGDAIGAGLSFYILYSSARLGVSKVGLSKMFFNIFVDATTGVIPILGDIIDVAWRANQKNAAILIAELEGKSLKPRDKMKITRTLIFVIVFVFIAIIFLITWILIKIF